MSAGGAAAAGLLLLHAGLAWLLRAPGLTTAQDDAVYLQLGRALRHLSYADGWLAGTPTESLYPPLYPALLAVTGGLFGDGLSVALALSAVLSAAALGGFYLLARRWSPGLALLLLAACAVNPSLVEAGGHVQSEPLFMCLSVLSLWWLTAPAPTPRTRLAAAVLAIAAALTRSIGIALLLAVLLQWLLERRFRDSAWFTLAAALTFGSWMAWTAAAPRQLAGQSYITDAVYAPPGAGAAPVAPAAPHDSLQEAAPAPAVEPRAPSDERAQGTQLAGTIAGRLTKNGPIYLARRIPAGLAMPTLPGTRLDNWFWLLLTAVFGAVGLVLLLRALPGAGSYLVFYMGVLLVWPYILPRFLVPVIPLVLLVALAGGRWFAGRWREGAGWAVAAGLAGILVLSGARVEHAHWQAQRGCDRSAPYETDGCFPAGQRAFFRAALDAGRRTPAGSILLTPKAATVFALTERQAVNELEAASLDAAGLQGYLHHAGVEYILLSHVHRDQWVIAGKLLPYCRGLELIAEYDEDALLLRVRGAEFTGPDACEAVRRFASVPWEEGAARSRPSDAPATVGNADSAGTVLEDRPHLGPAT